MKKILGLDLGTNSIGWAVVNEAESNDEKSSIVKLGVRAIKFDTFVSSDTKSAVKGDPADFFLLDPGEIWIPGPDTLYSKSCNTPFSGQSLYGRVRHHWLGGVQLF